MLDVAPDFGSEAERVGGLGEEGHDDEGVQFPDGAAALPEVRSRSKLCRISKTVHRVSMTASTDSFQMLRRRTAGHRQ